MKSKLNSDSFDIKRALKEDGVYAYGFGHIAKAAMFDHDLSCQAKGIYAYLCSFTNANNTAYPKLSTILNDLGIDKKTYYKHFNQLLENEYITIQKAKGYKNKNIYIINEYVKKVNCDLMTDDESESEFVIDGIKSYGYGTIPKLAMIDKRLTIKAKALMAFLLSLSGAGRCAFPRRDTICIKLGVTLNTYKSMLNELVSCGYIIVKQRRNKIGTFAINDYHFIINPVENIKQKTANVENSADVDNYVESCGKTYCAVENDKKTATETNTKNGLNSEVLPWTKNSPFLKNGLNSEFSPRTKNSPLLGSNRGPKIPPLPRTKNSTHNNINSNNSTTVMIGTSITNPSNKVIDNNIPDGNELKKSLHSISKYDYYINYSDNYALKHCRVVDILVNIFSKKSILHKDEQLVVADLWRYFVHILENNYTSDTPCVDFINEVLFYFDQCVSMYNIERPAKYLQTLIIDKIVCDYDDSVLIYTKGQG